MNTISFKNLNLSSELLSNLDTLNYLSMTPIQEKSLPLIIDGHDLIAKAKTGSGKTAAFGLGVLNKINVESFKLQALILCPTRELSEQVADELRRLGRMIKNLKVLVVCGGVAEYQQLNSLEHGVHIVVGTPGRVLKFLQRGDLNLKNIETFVLDEADRMLDMGFKDDMDEICGFTPIKKQSLLFSATFPDEIESLSQSFQKNPKRVEIDAFHEKEIIEQTFIEVETHPKKFEVLLKVLNQYNPETVVIFCKTKQTCNDVSDYLWSEKIEALPFHGDLEQKERTVVLSKFSNGSGLILVATDVAARGLDIKDLKAVINFDLAYDPEVHTHRIGRTARAGNNGVAISFFVPYEKEKIDGINDYLGYKSTEIKSSELKTTSLYDQRSKMKTIYINGGKKDKIRPGDILGAIINEAKLEASSIGNIDILITQTYVAIEASKVHDVISKLNAGKIKGRKFKVGLA
jgi:ATP-independent RNA helicase DbpA